MPASFFSNPHCVTTTTSPCTAYLTTGTGELAATSRATAALLWEFALGACPAFLREAGKRQGGAGYEAQRVGNVGYLAKRCNATDRSIPHLITTVPGVGQAPNHL